MRSVVSLPKWIDQHTFQPLLESFDLIRNSEITEIELDARALRFVEPIGLCLLCLLILKAQQSDVTVMATNIDSRLESFLNRMDFFANLPGLNYQQSTAVRAFVNTKAIVELNIVDKEADVEGIANQLAKALIQATDHYSNTDDGMTCSPAENAQHNIAYLFNEVLNNSVTHGKLRGYPHALAITSAMFNKNTGELSIAIVDDGCGLLESLKFHSQMPQNAGHAEAIELALQPRISCNKDLGVHPDTKNQGIGLTVSTEFAKRSGGKFLIFTGDTCYRDGESLIPTCHKITHWQGVGVSFVLNCRNLAGDVVSVGEILETIPGYKTVHNLNFL